MRIVIQAVLFCVAVGVATGVVMIYDAYEERSPRQQVSVLAGLAPAVESGQTGRIDPAIQAPDVPVALRRETYDTFITARQSADLTTMAQLRQDGRMFPVKPGTPVHVLESNSEVSIIRVLDGPYIGLTGWVEFGVVTRLTP